MSKRTEFRFGKQKRVAEELNRLDVYRRKGCWLCGRSYPDTLLNIEGVIHHGARYRCYDLKNCGREFKRKGFHERTERRVYNE